MKPQSPSCACAVSSIASSREAAGLHAALQEGLRNGTLRPVVGQQIPLADAPRAHEAVMAPGHRGKIVLIP